MYPPPPPFLRVHAVGYFPLWRLTVLSVNRYLRCFRFSYCPSSISLLIFQILSDRLKVEIPLIRCKSLLFESIKSCQFAGYFEKVLSRLLINTKCKVNRLVNSFSCKNIPIEISINYITPFSMNSMDSYAF